MAHIPVEMRVKKDAKEGRLYKYGYCDKVSANSVHFLRYEWIHTRQKNHLCTECNKSFSRSDYLTSLRSSVHGFRKTHECWACGKVLSSLNYTCVHTGDIILVQSVEKDLTV